jgi:hypothetical protein
MIFAPPGDGRDGVVWEPCPPGMDSAEIRPVSSESDDDLEESGVSVESVDVVVGERLPTLEQ